MGKGEWVAVGVTGLLAGASVMAGLAWLAGPALAQPTAPVSVRLSAGYGIPMPAGSWEPVTITLRNDSGARALRGKVLLTEAGGTCPPGPCFGPGFGPAQSSPATYSLAFDLAPGVTKALAADVVATTSSLRAAVVDQAGVVVATTAASLPVALGSIGAAVGVVSDDPDTLDGLGGLRLPQSGQVQVAHIPPASLPGQAVALSGFAALVLDNAGTEAITAGQQQALVDYVAQGGTLVLAGGPSWKPTWSGLPERLLPATVSGTAAAGRLDSAAALLGAAPLSGTDEIAVLVPRPLSAVELGDRAVPLQVEAPYGAGKVVALAMDPASPPFAGWAGTPTLLRRVLIEASSGSGRAAGPYPEPAGGQLASMSTDAVLLNSGVTTIPAVGLPSATTLVLLLIAYLAVVGPLNFVVLGRLGHRDWAWLSVPAISAAALAIAYATGLGGAARGVAVNQVRLVWQDPGSDRAAVESFAAVYLPHGGTHQLALGGQPAPTGLPGTDGVSVQLGPTVQVGVSGPPASVHGFASAGFSSLAGKVSGTLSPAGSSLVGTVTNHLPVALLDARVITDGGRTQALGTLGAGRTDPVKVANPGPACGGVSFSTGAGPSLGLSQDQRLQLERNDVLQGLTAGLQPTAGQALLIALARKPLLGPGVEGPGVAVGDLDVVIAPLDISAPSPGSVSGLAGQLVDVSGMVPGYGPPCHGSVLLQGSGSALFRFSLGSGTWKDVRISPPSACPPGTPCTGPPIAAASQLRLEAFDPARGEWVPLAPSSGKTTQGATIADPAPYLGYGGTLYVRAQMTGNLSKGVGLQAMEGLTLSGQREGAAA